MGVDESVTGDTVNRVAGSLGATVYQAPRSAKELGRDVGGHRDH